MIRFGAIVVICVSLGCDEAPSPSDEAPDAGPPVAAVMPDAGESDASVTPLQPPPLRANAVTCKGARCATAISSTFLRDSFCAVVDGSVVCWGANGAGERGNGTTELVQSGPSPVLGVTNAVAVDKTCAVLAGGGVKCWGESALYLEPDSASTVHPSPVALDLPPVAKISVGENAACALLEDHRVLCWGYDTWAQLAYAKATTPFTPPTPLAVAGRSAFADVAVGAASYVTLDDGSIWTWGRAVALGRWCSLPNDGTPTALTLGAVSTIEANRSSGCAVANRRLHCWGPGRTLPRDMEVADVVQVALDATDNSPFARRGCAVTQRGSLHCWGPNAFGQVGDGTIAFVPRPVSVSMLSEPVVTVAMTATATCALLEGGRVSCWGDNGSGQLGQPYVGGVSGAALEVAFP